MPSALTVAVSFVKLGLVEKVLVKAQPVAVVVNRTVDSVCEYPVPIALVKNGLVAVKLVLTNVVVVHGSTVLVKCNAYSKVAVKTAERVYGVVVRSSYCTERVYTPI